MENGKILKNWYDSRQFCQNAQSRTKETSGFFENKIRKFKKKNLSISEVS